MYKALLKVLKMAKQWIAKAIKKPGSLRKSLGISKKTGTIPVKKIVKAAKGKGITAKRANLAKTLSKLHK